MLAHQPNRLLTRRRRLLHLFLPVQLIAGIEKALVVPFADQRIQRGFAQPLVQVDLFVLRAPIAEETPRVAAGASSRLQVEFQRCHFSGVPSSTNVISFG
jgi:hypothetical protein